MQIIILLFYQLIWPIAGRNLAAEAHTCFIFQYKYFYKGSLKKQFITFLKPKVSLITGHLIKSIVKLVVISKFSHK